MNIILHDPVITDLFVHFIERCNYLRNKRNDIDHVENLQINTKIPRDDVENVIDLTSREDIPVNHHSINSNEVLDFQSELALLIQSKINRKKCLIFTNY